MADERPYGFGSFLIKAILLKLIMGRIYRTDYPVVIFVECLVTLWAGFCLRSLSCDTETETYRSDHIIVLYSVSAGQLIYMCNEISKF